MNSEKYRIIVLSGQRGIGKSTVCRQIAKSMRDKRVRCAGIITYKSQDSGVIIEDVETGESEILASVRPEYGGPRIGQYVFNPEGLRFGLAALEQGLSADLLFVDELGHLEVKGEGFAAVFDYLARDTFKHAIVVIREELLSALLPRFHGRPEVVKVTKDNRDGLVEQVLSLIFLHQSLPSDIQQE